MPTVVVIPVKSFRLGKQRLAEAIEAGARARLGRVLADRVASVAESVSLLPLIVTADPDVAAWAISSGFPSVADPGAGLDRAASTGVEWALRSNSRWIVLHSDLPLIDRGDMTVLDRALADGDTPIAPSADGGTSAVAGAEPFEFSYGEASFHRHLGRLASPRVVFRLGLALDIDNPNDLHAAVGHPRGAWLAQSLG